MTDTVLLNPCCPACRHRPAEPCVHSVECVEKGPLCHDDDACRELRRIRLLQARRGGEGTLIFLGLGTCGLANGAADVRKRIEAFLAQNRVAATVIDVGCIGYCQKEVIVDVAPSGGPRIAYAGVTPENIDGLLADVLCRGRAGHPLALGWHADPDAAPSVAPDGVPALHTIPFFARQQKVVLENCGVIDPVSLDAALARGAFRGLSRALSLMTPAEVCDTVLASGLKGRGGGGFPTGRKWQVAHGQPSAEKYVVCNADEGDPGAFMDRAVLEGDPYRVLEGLAIAAYAIGARRGYIYCRAEYPLAIARLEAAIARMRETGLLGDNILDSQFAFDVKVKPGAGAFVCGEETAIIASIEGRRGMPRPRPPYPAEKGLYGKPTVLNNVETLANVPAIVARGAEWFASIGKGDAGTKVFALSGAVRNTGLVEVPIGMSLRELVEGVGGGVAAGHRLKAVQIGGPSGGCLPADQLDVPVDYRALQERGAIMGSGGLVVMDERSCMVDVAKYFMEFVRSESCGKCAPCREGTTRLYEILAALCEKPVGDEGNRLTRFRGLLAAEELAETVREASLCGLGQTAANPVLSTLRYFRDEYEAHLHERRCPAGACQGLRVFAIDNALCIGCTMCRKACPQDAVMGERKQAHYIIEDRCIGCGACVTACPKEAIGVAPWRP
ncbi:MAG: 4Fe-4S binding protein [Acidobacteriota bacterium]|jgi:NADH:ubiquinone oxidoreductase subunit F (NADH-binding)/Pyruvate/2-oxoacid:ferredoxin oxidoreductase delta subunit/(2Fe-2S) ferredoxin|nr:4Fe-4S binding protein [Acidobacteriota bacterium]